MEYKATIEGTSPVIWNRPYSKEELNRISTLPDVEQAEYRAYRMDGSGSNLALSGAWLRGAMKEYYVRNAPNKKKGEYMNLQQTLEYATKVHEGQTSKNGTPFIYHPMAVAGIVGDNFHNNETLQIAALLHDVVEDTNTTCDDLKDIGFPERVVTAVHYLTRQEGELYKVFINRCSTNKDAMKIKMCDIIHNIRRASDLPDKDEEKGLRRRWGQSLTYLWERYKNGNHSHNSSFEVTVAKTIEENMEKYNQLNNSEEL